MEILYVNVLHMIMHSVGLGIHTPKSKESIFSYLQSSFEYDDEKHAELMKEAESKEAPRFLLQVEVIEAKDLMEMDTNGLSDTFCTLYLESSQKEKYNTTVKSETLSPEWKEHFSLSVQDPSKDILYVEAWDFDPAETVSEKLWKVNDLKGMKGFRKLVNEFPKIGKDVNQFIGRAYIPLESICPTGEIRWCDIEKEGHSGKRGSVKLKLGFSSKKSTESTLKDHGYLLRILLLYQLEGTEYKPFTWNGLMENSAQIILTQHLVQSGLSPFMEAFIQWVEFCSIHREYPMNFKVFTTLLWKILPELQNKLLDSDKEMMFWEATKILMPSCVNGLRQLGAIAPNKKNICQVEAILRIISYVSSLKLPEGFELFPTSLYEWLIPLLEDNRKCSIINVVKQAIIYGTEELCCDALENNSVQTSSVLKIIEHASKNLQAAIEIYDKLFQECLYFSYGAVVYKVYNKLIPGLVKSVVMEIHENLKPLQFDEKFLEVNEADFSSAGIQLLELYLTLQKFVEYGSKLCCSEEEHILSNYYIWFCESVTLWIDVAMLKAKKMIKKAVALDELIPLSDIVHRSSSAVDTICIYNEINIFWRELSWPDIEGAYALLAQIIDNVRVLSLHYIQLMTQKVEDLNSNTGECNLYVSKEWCLAINNIAFIGNFIETFANDLGMNAILEALDSCENSMSSKRCRETLRLLINNSLEGIGANITLLFRRKIEQITTVMTKLLGTVDPGSGRDKLLECLDQHLSVLNSNLENELFQEILLIFWENVAIVMCRIIEERIQEKRPRMIYQQLKETTEMLLYLFRSEDEQNVMDYPKALQDAQEKLRLYSMETSQLIHQYYLERLEEQRLAGNSSLGMITIIAYFRGNRLEIKVLSCRNLPAKDSNGSSDPYVELYLLPTEKFIGVPKLKTKTIKKSLFPLFDETFSYMLSKDQRWASDGILLLAVRDDDIIGDDFIGEVYVKFCEIEEVDETENEHTKQTHLNLTSPKNFGSEVFKTLKYRQDDKRAKEFLRKEKMKVH